MPQQQRTPLSRGSGFCRGNQPHPVHALARRRARKLPGVSRADHVRQPSLTVSHYLVHVRELHISFSPARTVFRTINRIRLHDVRPRPAAPSPGPSLETSQLSPRRYLIALGKASLPRPGRHAASRIQQLSLSASLTLPRDVSRQPALRTKALRYSTQSSALCPRSSVFPRLQSLSHNRRKPASPLLRLHAETTVAPPQTAGAAAGRARLPF
jgi:hypothetical protein